MGIRAQQSGVKLEPPYLPDSFREFVKNNDPVAAPYHASTGNPFTGKSVLVLSGKEDPLVVWEASEEFVNKLNVGEGDKTVIVEAGARHECTKAMQFHLAKYVWSQALVESKAKF